ncbi:MAG: hypothetical protein HPY50_12300 [Firmicutes bacterium]|nr:hypothetical protein [Bacillota bacterium]
MSDKNFYCPSCREDVKPVWEHTANDRMGILKFILAPVAVAALILCFLNEIFVFSIAVKLIEVLAAMIVAAVGVFIFRTRVCPKCRTNLNQTEGPIG